MRKRLFHRGHNIELTDEKAGQYSARLGGRRVSGTLLGVKQSIDWWCDTNVVCEPNEFDKQEFNPPQQKGVEDYKGIQIMNDTPDNNNTWYMMIKGRLLKGSLPALKQFIDKRVATKS
ncbi:DUF3319 domain-containing protein [Grimontia hollisae]|uniref:DUF3319 domain-containing protein n=2 Tax=Grimontia hollisae TaxID=673 RepID=D0I5I7_GRIHO|nr:DUF3319 domain-containing protein [Grimontia hollisae]AMG29237.1 DUF3319 domain-containing protein [Grimontia hollisae]EEY73151.1 hypothetical protein VHA_001004 [Grimontia hollisae CIP 101886]MDF2185471.1 DUF3319 domain-containing protein [Grimontia hollisae]STO76621.1 Protein of uncharacterised function (DUF3319) [Grimontia hollisae]STO98724.1 Protein of uncharacterised function (DUF3319) [Grimontia hollisae]